MSETTNSKGRDGQGPVGREGQGPVGSDGQGPVGDGDNAAGDAGFVVRDRRRFESDGRSKDDVAKDDVSSDDLGRDDLGRDNRVKDDNDSAESGGEVASSDRKQDLANTNPNSGGGSGGFEEVSFSSFVMSLATQALMQLGVVPPPQGYELPQDIQGAKQTIDLLQMLQDKTKGNLDAQEVALIEDILHNVRLAFVRRK